MIKDRFDIDSELVRGRGGLFNVFVDEAQIFSKHDTDRFPTDEEIVEQIEKMR